MQTAKYFSMSICHYRQDCQNTYGFVYASLTRADEQRVGSPKSQVGGIEAATFSFLSPSFLSRLVCIWYGDTCPFILLCT